jgi:hypothetical protein
MWARLATLLSTQERGTTERSGTTEAAQPEGAEGAA